MSLMIIGGIIVAGLAAINDPTQTVKLCTAILSVRGITFLAKKITHTLNKDASDMIDMAGWCIAGISIVPLLVLAIGSVQDVAETIEKIANGIKSVGGFLEKPFEIGFEELPK